MEVLEKYNSVWGVEQFFECSDKWDSYEDFYYDLDLDNYEGEDIPYEIALDVCDIFELKSLANGCSRVAVKFGDYVAKVCTQQGEWGSANDRELELVSYVIEIGREDLLKYLVPIVGEVNSKRYSECLVAVMPLCKHLSEVEISFEEILKTKQEIRNAFYEAGIKLEDTNSINNYGIHEGQIKLLDYAEWYKLNYGWDKGSKYCE